MFCCVKKKKKKKICLSIEKINSRGRSLPRYDFFFVRYFFGLFLFHVSIVFFYTLGRKISIRVGSKLGK